MTDIPLLQRRTTHFVLWRPSYTRPVPQIRIGTYSSNGLQNVTQQALVQSPEVSELWELAATDLGLENGKVYHYWFLVGDSNPKTGIVPPTDFFVVTDPFATTVDRRLMSGPLRTPPYNDDDRDAAGVVLFQGNKLIPCDPGGETPDWSGEGEMKNLPPNNKLVMYELPTRWAKSEDRQQVGIGTFQDVLALVREDATGANFNGLAALQGSHIKALGVNALELLPPADSYQVQTWGYGTSNYLSADFDLGKPEGQTAPTASRDLAALISACHSAGIRFFLDVVMAFASHASYENINFLDFHVQPGTGDPEESDRGEAYGGFFMKYNYRVNGFDPVSGKTNQDLVPARQWMKVFLTRWMQDYHVDGIRMDDVSGIKNWDFVQECNDLTRSLWQKRWGEKYGVETESSQECNARFLVVGEELSVPMQLVNTHRADSMWNDHFKWDVKNAVIGSGSDDDFGTLVERMIDCGRWGFGDGSQAINYITSHDVGNDVDKNDYSSRLYNFLVDHGHDPAQDQGKRIKLAFVCLLTAVGIPMILAGEEFADKQDLPITDSTAKQIDPVNFDRLNDPWRKDLFDYVARLIKFRTTSDALSVDDTRFIDHDIQPRRRVVTWIRGEPDSDQVVVVANFSDWHSTDPTPMNNWPRLPSGYKWREITTEADVPPGSVGAKPLRPWQAMVYAMVPQ